ncbi:DUF2066 domain-containing protein [Azospirillum halopraeferens]|uniref:DUF2066 domain-containing protein n=1 Tax=Azospirillum halopraeferens TaxID=34010 RepID=UPI000408756D|nr:DUF2066 domain-containing protein [Azospirillum halopraeferens]
MLHRRRRSLWPGLAAVILILAGLLGPVAARAQTGAAAGDAAFTVSGIAVDVSAANANAARDRAILEAQRKGWDELYRRLVPGAGSAPSVSDTDLFRLVQGFEIADERVSATRYVGTYTVRFRPQPVRDLLAGSTASYVEPPTRPLVVLPVTIVDGRPVLWEDRTAWREAWEAREPGASLVPLLVPDGELDDIAAIGVGDALEGNADALSRIVQRYNASGAVVARTELPAGGPDVARGMTVEVTRYGADGDRVQQSVPVRPDASDRPEDLLNRAVVFTAAALDEAWRRENTVAAGPEQSLYAAVPVASLADWLETRRRLDGINAVTRLDILSLSRGEAVVMLHYRGDVGRLREALSRRNLTLSEAPGTAVPPAPAVPGQLGTLPARPLSAGPSWVIRQGGSGASAAAGAFGPAGAGPAGSGFVGTPLPAPGAPAVR